MSVWRCWACWPISSGRRKTPARRKRRGGAKDGPRHAGEKGLEQRPLSEQCCLCRRYRDQDHSPAHGRQYRPLQQDRQPLPGRTRTTWTAKTLSWRSGAAASAWRTGTTPTRCAQDGRTETRTGDGEWQSSDDSAVAFAPEGDFLAFLDMAQNVAVASDQAPAKMTQPAPPWTAPNWRSTPSTWTAAPTPEARAASPRSRCSAAASCRPAACADPGTPGQDQRLRRAVGGCPRPAGAAKGDDVDSRRRPAPTTAPRPRWTSASPSTRESGDLGRRPLAAAAGRGDRPQDLPSTTDVAVNSGGLPSPWRARSCWSAPAAARHFVTGPMIAILFTPLLQPGRPSGGRPR